MKSANPCRLRSVWIAALHIEADTGAESQTHIKQEKTLSALWTLYVSAGERAVQILMLKQDQNLREGWISHRSVANNTFKW